MIGEKMYLAPRTFRDYKEYELECARVQGWNDAMDFIFGKATAPPNLRIVDCTQTEKGVSDEKKK